MITPSNGVRLAIDVGTSRIGIAKCDQEQLMALPVTTIAANENSIREVSELVTNLGVGLVYVGKPISLNTNRTASTQMAIDFATKLSKVLTIPVHLVDERLTTVSALSQIHSSGKDSKSSLAFIDQVAAVILLDHAIAIEKSTHTLAGEVILPRENT